MSEQKLKKFEYVPWFIFIWVVIIFTGILSASSWIMIRSMSNYADTHDRVIKIEAILTLAFPEYSKILSSKNNNDVSIGTTNN